MKICILNDTHCGTRNSSEILLNNADTFYSETMFPYLLKHDIKHIVHLGDYFDNRKFIVPPRVIRQYSFATIFRIIIKNQDLEITVGLAEKGFNAIGDMLLLIAARNQN